jgi:hypothetical protein
MALLIQLTEDDISNGKPTSDACPIALAATRAFKRPVQVYYSFIMGRKKGWMLVHLGHGKYAVFRLETAVAEWARRWDDTRLGKPFDFYIDTKGLLDDKG